MLENEAKPKKKRASHAKKQFVYTQTFSSDIVLDDMLFGLLVRSPVQCGTVPEIELPELPEGVSFFSAKDIPGSNNVAVKNASTSIFADKEILYLGQPLGILVGPDEHQLNELLPSIGFSMDPLNIPMGLEFTDSFSADQLIANRSIIHGEPDSTFEKEEHKFEQTFSLDFVQPKVERNSCVVSYTGKQLHIYTNSQWAKHLRSTVAETLAINDSHILIHKTHQVNTKINDTWITSVTAAQIAVASFHLHKPVKLVYSLSEQETYIERIEPASIRFRTSCNNEGKITSLDICMLVNAGIINPFIQYILDRFVIAATGAYKIENLRIDAYAIKTNQPPLNCSFTWGDTQAFFAIENHIHYIANQLKIDINQIRKQNFLKPNDEDFYCKIDTSSVNEVIKKASIRRAFIDKESKTEQESSEYERRNSAYNLISESSSKNTHKHLRGIGLAVAHEGSCFLAEDLIRNKYSLETTLETDGSLSVKIFSPSEHLKTIWLRLIEKLLDIPSENVNFETDYSNTEEPEEPDVLSLNITVMTQLLKKCCMSLQKSRFRQPLPISIKKTFMPSRKKPWNTQDFCGQPFLATSWAAAVVEVEVNTVTYEISVRDVNIAIECGELLDEKSAISAVKTESAKLLTSFVEPNSLNIIYPKVSFIQSGENPKEIGSIIESILPAAFSSAVSQAIGVPVTNLPLQTDSIFNLLAQKEMPDEN